MKEVSIYGLVSCAIIAGDNDINVQYKNICGLFIDGLFYDETEVIRVFEGDGEYHLLFEGYISTGKTPALALRGLLQMLIETPRRFATPGETSKNQLDLLFFLEKVKSNGQQGNAPAYNQTPIT